MNIQLIHSMKLLLATLLLFTSFTFAQSGAAKFPVELESALDHDFPGWKLAKIDSDLQRRNDISRIFAKRGFVSGDFDGDGRKDYAVMIVRSTVSGDEQVVIAYLNAKTGLQKHLLDT